MQGGGRLSAANGGEDDGWCLSCDDEPRRRLMISRIGPDALLNYRSIICINAAAGTPDGPLAVRESTLSGAACPWTPADRTVMDSSGPDGPEPLQADRF